MKKQLFFGLLLVSLSLVSCTQDVEISVSHPKPDSAIAINIHGSIDQVTATRVNDDGFCDGDGFGLFAVNYEDGVPGTLLDKDNQANNVRYIFNESENTWTPDYPVYYRDNVTPVDMIGYYPYNGALESVNNYNFEVQQDQSTTVEAALMGGYEASDFLWGKVENIQPTAERINIKFNHAMAGVQVELKEGNGWEDGEWASVQKHALIANTIRRASIDLATGIITPVGEREITDIVPALNGEYYRAIVVPQSVDGSMVLLRITIDGTPYLFRKSEAFEYQAGKLHKFAISVSKREDSGVELNLVNEEITPWESETISHDGAAREYVVIHVPQIINNTSSSLKAAIDKSQKDYKRIVNLKVTGKLSNQDFSFIRTEMIALSNLNIEEVTLCNNSSITNELPNFAFQNSTKIKRIILPSSTEHIGNCVFERAKVDVVQIPDNVKTIGSQAFDGAEIKTKLQLPHRLEEIGDWAFADFKGEFENFALPETLTSIGSYAFRNFKLCCEIKLPDGLKTIGDCAFYNCDLVGALRLPQTIDIIRGSTFSGNNFSGTLELPQGIIEIGSGAFLGNNFTGELILPNGCVRVGSQAFLGCDFSGELKLPNSLIEIGESAFFCTNIKGTIEIPSGITELKAKALPPSVSKIVIHSGVRTITGTFEGLHLKEVVCNAKTPPTLSAHSFRNTSKGSGLNNQIEPVKIEVPEESLYKYQTASYWKDYIPSVYRDFNLDLESTSALNAKHSRKMIVRAPGNMEWSVTHKPDWVTVTPSSGTGKVEVTISFDEMARGNGNRADSLVFKPTAYDYHKSVKVDQYDYPYDSGDVIINQTATVGNGVNIVFMGDCFDAKDIAEGYYEEIMNEAIGHFFAIEPYTTYRDYFNVYTVVCHSTDSGLPTTYTINNEVIFESQYAFGDNGRFEFRINTNKCLEYACKVPTVTKDNICQTPVVVIENSNIYGGVTYMWNDNSSIAVQCIQRNDYPYDFRGVIQHEVGGHAFGKLLDEYMYHGGFVDQCSCVCCEHDSQFELRQSLGWGKNMSLNSNHYEVPWSHMIFDPQYSSYVEMYEGGFFHQRGVYRSEPNSCMNNNVAYYSAISRQAIVERIMEYAGEEFTFEKFKAKDSDEIGAIPLSMTRCVATEAESYNPLHNEPVIMGDKPALNF